MQCCKPFHYQVRNVFTTQAGICYLHMTMEAFKHISNARNLVIQGKYWRTVSKDTLHRLNTQDGV